MSWSIPTLVAYALDRPGFRGPLSALGSTYVRNFLGVDAEIFFDRVWLHKCNGVAWPDGPRFRYFADVVKTWPSEAKRVQQATRRNWLQLYQPGRGDVIVDVGAGMGAELLLLANEVGDSGRIFAIEAHPVTFLGLKKFCQHNRLRNVVPVHAAVSAEAGFVSISDAESHEANTIIEETTCSGSCYSVPAVTLDSLVEDYRLDRIDFLKVNIEGAERHVIRGMADAIGRVTACCIACHDFRADRGEGEGFRTKETVIAFLQARGFEVMLRDEDLPGCIRDHVHARRKTA